MADSNEAPGAVGAELPPAEAAAPEKEFATPADGTGEAPQDGKPEPDTQPEAIGRLVPRGTPEQELTGEQQAQGAQPIPAARTQTPTIGRIVHYLADETGAPGLRAGETYPAIITRVFNDDSVNLTVFLDNGYVLGRSSMMLGRDWFWPPRA